MKQNKSLATAILALALFVSVARGGEISNPSVIGPPPPPPTTQPTASTPVKGSNLLAELIGQFSVLLSRIAR